MAKTDIKHLIIPRIQPIHALPKKCGEHGATIHWLQQVVLLESFFKNLGLSFYMAITFDQIQRTVNNLMHINRIKTLWNHTSFANKAHKAHDIIAKSTSFGPNRHPLAEGHELIANYIIQDQAWPETKGNI